MLSQLNPGLLSCYSCISGTRPEAGNKALEVQASTGTRWRPTEMMRWFLVHSHCAGPGGETAEKYGALEY